MSDDDECSDICHDDIHPLVYDATPVKFDENSVMQWIVGTHPSDEEAFISEESDLEDQLRHDVVRRIPRASSLVVEETLGRDVLEDFTIRRTQNIAFAS